MRFLFRRVSTIDFLTYLDADLYFFSSPEPLLSGELQNSSVGIVSHRFPSRLKERERYGHFNVGWVSFRRNQEGLACLDWWRARCLEWCFDRCEPERFADQKYLDSFPKLFTGVCSISHRGANVAPWNLFRAKFEKRNSRLFVDGDPLLFFHFHGVKRVAGNVFSLGCSEYGVRPGPLLKRNVFGCYLRELCAIEKEFPSCDQGFGLTRAGLEKMKVTSGKIEKIGLRLWGHCIKGILRHHYGIVCGPFFF